jgi:hypothetical protein
MRKLTIVLLAAVVAMILVSVLIQADEKAWFDLENCDFCKQLTTPPDLLENMGWEHYNISNGLISVTTVNDGYMEAYLAAQARMEETGKKMQKGEPVKMCNMCMAMGKLMMKGVKMENIQTQHGDILLMTSDDPEVVKEIQAWGKRNNDEMAKMEQSEKKQ